MQAAAPPILRDLVLVGGGHSHVGVLRAFGMQPLAGLRITLVCTDAHTPYSGMLPGYVAGHYDFDAVHLDLVRLCVFAGARFVRAQVTGLDRERRQVLLADRPPLDYDLVSINTGSTPHTTHIAGADAHAVSVKPIAAFNQRWLTLLAAVRAGQGPRHIAVVGAGAGGVELLLAMQYRLRAETQALGGAVPAPQFSLFSATASVLPTHNTGVQRKFAAVLRQRGVDVHLHTRVESVDAQGLRSADGTWHAADAVFWVTQAAGGAWLQGTGLALDAAGCVRVNAQLQSISDARIFAAGDVASLDNRSLEKAGVFAVRMGVPLARNLRRALTGQALQPYRAQAHWLALISTGDRYAVASRGALGFAGAWVWRWKDHIDRRFMRRFSDLGAPGMGSRALGSVQAASLTGHSVQAASLTGRSVQAAGVTGRSVQAASVTELSAQEALQAQAAQAMRCGGCGAKVGAGVLAKALAGLRPLANPDVLIGLHAPDDAAVVRVPPGKAVVQTVDFFRAFVDDPYLFGRIAANHALGDIFAMGAQAHTATAIATVPPGIDRQTQACLAQMMTGAVEVLNAAGCTLVGGHTGEGQELALGFAINGLIDVDAQGEPRALLRKAGLQAGDVLVLTKPLGTGTVFAAHGLGQARGRWVQAALRSMDQSNQAAAATLATHGARCCTDVTGFGLLGHLAEMVQASGVGAAIELLAVPVLDGALECLGAGLTSSLHSANAQSAQRWLGPAAKPRTPQQCAFVALLLDPQTAGGLLAGVPADHAAACIAALRAQGYPQACVIGRAKPYAPGAAAIEIVEPIVEQ